MAISDKRDKVVAVQPAGDLSPFSGLYLDRYELTMALAYRKAGRADEPAVFDYFFRQLPFGGGYAVFAGLGTLVEALEAFRFGPDECAFLRHDGFPDDFLDYLRGFAFRGSIWAPPEGEPVFPIEPIVRVEGGLLETQIIETLLLNVVNFQTLIATKAARCRAAAAGRAVSEFGFRRAHGLGARWASRAACIGGASTTSNLDAARAGALRTAGTMAHAFVQSYEREIDAFRCYAHVHGSRTILLLDTYDTLRSGLPNAITIARELESRGAALAGVRLDSGDLAYLSVRVREGLDQAGFPNVKIVASNQLDEYVIRSLLGQGAPIDIFGVGTSLATGMPDAALDGIYKLAAVTESPRIKCSESVTKTTLPGRKTVTRFRDDQGHFRADAVHFASDPPPRIMVHPHEPHPRLDLSSWTAEPLQRRVVADGRVEHPLPGVEEAAAYARQREQALPPEHRRFENPHRYKVGLSPELRSGRDLLLAEKQQNHLP